MRFIKIMFLAFLCNFSTLQAQDIVDEYIGAFQYIAVSEMERTGIPASIKLAQGLLESSWGRSELSTEAHNHFGIKCGSSWEGDSFLKEDDDYDKNGKLKKSCFRVFESDEASYIAHSEFLLSNNRYGFLFEYSETNHKAWAKGLRKAGYASDPAYPSKLIGIIKKYNLARFDYMVADEMHLLAEGGNRTQPTEKTAEEAFMEEALEEEEVMTADEKEEVIAENSDQSLKSSAEEAINDIQKSAMEIWNRQKAKRKKSNKQGFNLDQLLAEVKAIGDDILGTEKEEDKITSTPDIEQYNEVKMTIAEVSETLEDIAVRVNVSAENLEKYNDNLYSQTQTLHRGTVIYLAPKNTVFTGSANSHYVQGRERIVDIAQKYGITEMSIRKRNYLKENEEVKHGEILYLRGVRISGKPETRKVKTSDNRYLFETNTNVD